MPESTIIKRFVLTRAEDAELNAFLLRLRTASGCKVPVNVVVRAVLAILMENVDRIAGTSERIRPQLPSTHDRLALGQLEEQWRGCMVEVMLECWEKINGQGTTRAKPKGGAADGGLPLHEERRIYGCYPSAAPHAFHNAPTSLDSIFLPEAYIKSHSAHHKIDSLPMSSVGLIVKSSRNQQGSQPRQILD